MAGIKFSPLSIGSPQADFAFIQDDVRKQREIARRALEEALEIDRALGQVVPDDARRDLEKARDVLLQLAEDLARNANSTSATASTVVSMIVSSSST